MENCGNISSLGSTGSTKVESDLDPFTYRGLNKDLDPIFNGSEPSGNRRIRDPFTSLIIEHMEAELIVHE